MKARVNQFNAVRVGNGVVSRPKVLAVVVMTQVVTHSAQVARKSQANGLPVDDAVRAALNGLQKWHSGAERKAAERTIRNFYALAA